VSDGDQQALLCAERKAYADQEAVHSDVNSHDEKQTA
jgi:hypothetical protein